jgi:NADPH2:quinone reductase
MFNAVVGDALGPIENYTLRAVNPRAPGPREVQVAVRAAGVSFVDVLVAAGRYQVRPPVPFTPGSEIAGVVTAVGNEVDGVAVGQPVIATGWHGMFAERVTLPASAVWPKPACLSFAEASVLLVSYATVWHALVDRGKLQRGETLVVLGAGGATGYAAVQIGKHLGARVIASASSEAKRAMATAGGADAVIEARATNWRDQLKSATGGKPVDVVFDPVGGPATEPAFRSLGWDGRHLVVGFPAGIASLATNLPLLKGASLVGVNLNAFAVAEPERARANHLRVVELADVGCKPVIAQTYDLTQFAAAMRAASQGESAGRIVLTMDSAAT